MVKGTMTAVFAALPLLFLNVETSANSLRGPPAVRPASGATAPASPRAVPAPRRQAAPTVQQQAQQLRSQAGRNSVTVQRGNGDSTRYDLAGNSHYNKSTGQDVPTPHVTQQRRQLNVNPATGQTFPRTVQTQAQPMTQSDIRVVRRVLQNRQGTQGKGGAQ